MTKPIDPEILTRIIVLQSSLHAASDEKRLGEMVCYTMSKMPGTVSAAFYRDNSLLAHFASDLLHPHEWAISWQAQQERIASEKSGFASLPIQTHKSDYGVIALLLSEQEEVQSYLPYLENTANIIALMLENRNQDAALRDLNAGLESQVKDRVRALQESEERLRLAVDGGSVGIWQWDIATNKLDWNDQLKVIFGLPLSITDLTLEKFMSAIYPADLTEVESAFRSALSQHKEFKHEYRILRPDNSLHWIVAIGRGIYDPAGLPIRMLGCALDITDRKRVEELLRETEDLFSLFMKHSPIYTFIKRIEGNRSRVIQLSDNFIDMLGRPAEEMRGRTMEEMFSADFARKITADDIAVVREGKVMQFEEDLNGRIYTTIKFPIVRAGKDNLLAGFTIEITERKRAEEALQESEERYRNVYNTAPLAFVLWDRETHVTDWNIQAERIFGWSREEIIGQNFFDYIIPETAHSHVRKVADLLLEGTLPSHSINENITKSGKIIVCEWNNTILKDSAGNITGVLSLGLDVTERRRAEEEHIAIERQLLHAQKLESLGVLAGGIAHDFNNILMAVIGNADLAMIRMNPESPAIENLRQIEQAAARAADLARQMLAYSGKGQFVIEHLDMNCLVQEMLHMLEVSISKKAVLRLNLTPDLPAIEADATQMRQIVMNLVINASEAIGDRSGVIAVTTGCVNCDRRYLKDVWLDENIREGLYVYLDVADTGCGMDEETLSKIFDPFFTTKFTGRGLGMAAVLGIIRGHKGTIKVYSEPGKGTTFRVLLPASDRPAERFNSNNSHKDARKGSGTVLLVDDEESVRAIGSEMLKELGYTPVTASNGREAIAITMENPDVAFVLLDLTMPHMGGEQCFHELRKIRPDITIIMSSGYNEQEVTQKFVGKGLSGFIQKPYKLTALKEAIRKIG